MRLSIGFTGFTPLAATLPVVNAAEQAGFSGVWSCEHVGYHDAIVPSSAYVHTTKNLEIGLTGLSIKGRHPGLTAMELASLSEFGPGRVRVHVGTGDPILMALIDGAVQQGALDQVKGFVETLRRLLAGEQVTVNAPSYTCNGLRLMFAGAPVAIDVMAMRPRMIKLAAQIGDGISLGAWSSRAYLREVVQIVEQELAALGRDRSTFRISAFVLVVLNESLDLARQSVAGLMGILPPENHAALPVLARDVPLPDLSAIMDVLGRGDMAALAELYLPCVDGFGMITTPAMLTDALAAYRELGIDEFIVTFTPMEPLESQLRAISMLAEANTRPA